MEPTDCKHLAAQSAPISSLFHPMNH